MQVLKHMPHKHFSVEIVDGDLLEQNVDVIVNAWNRNIIPWWLLWPQGVSAAIKKKGGYQPFKELGKKGPIPLGGAVITSAGRLPFKAIIHVAGINLLWFSSQSSVILGVKNAMRLAAKNGFQSIAMPLIGAGTGGSKQGKVLTWMQTALHEVEKEALFQGRVIIVCYKKSKKDKKSLLV